MYLSEFWQLEEVGISYKYVADSCVLGTLRIKVEDLKEQSINILLTVCF